MGVSFSVSGAFIGEDLEFVEGPLTIVLNEGVIESVSKSSSGVVDLRGYVAVPPLANMHTHLLDYAILESGWDLDIDSVVGEPYGLKYVLLNTLDVESLRLRLSEVVNYIVSEGVGFIAEFRELGVKGLLIDYGRRLPTHYVLGMPSKHDDVDAEVTQILSVADGIGISSPHYFKEEDLKKIFNKASTSGKLLHSHISETVDTHEEGDLSKLLKAGKPNAVIHAVWLNDEELDLINNLNIPVVLCLRSNLWFTSGLPKIRKIYETGVNVSLGTDNAGWVKPDIWRDAELLYFLLRYQGINDPRWVLKALTNASPVNIRNFIDEGQQANILFVRYYNTPLEIARNKYVGLIKRGGMELVDGLIIHGLLAYCRVGTGVEALRDYIRNDVGRR